MYGCPHTSLLLPSSEKKVAEEESSLLEQGGNANVLLQGDCERENQKGAMFFLELAEKGMS